MAMFTLKHRIIGLVVSLIGVIVLLGWWLDLPWLKSGLIGGSSQMTIEAAMCFGFTGVALAILSQNPRANWQRWSVQALATIALSIALLRLIYFWHHKAFYLLPAFSHYLSTTELYSPLSFSGAVNFGLISIALWLLTWNRNLNRLLAQVLALIVLAITTLALSSYLFNTNLLAAITQQSSLMSLPSGITFLLLVGGLLMVHPRVGFLRPIINKALGGVMARRLLPWAIMLPILMGWLIYLGSEKFKIYDHSFSHALGVSGMIGSLTLLIWVNARSLNQVSHHLQKTNEQLITFLEANTDGFIAVDSEWRYTYINAQAERLLQCSRNQLLGKLVWQVYPDLINSVAESECKRAIAEQVPVKFEMAYEPLELEIEVHVFPTGNGLTICLRDISEQKHSQRVLQQLNELLENRVSERTAALLASNKQLQVSQNRLALAQKVASIGSWEYELASDRITWSIETFRIFGCDPLGGEPDYSALLQLYIPEDAVRLDRAVRRAIATGEGYRLDLQIRSSNGTPRWLESTGEAICNAAEVVERLIGTIQDITERKQLEAQLRLQAERERLLSSMVQRIHESLDYNTVLWAIVSEVCELLATDRVLIYQFQSDWSGQIVIEAVQPSYEPLLNRVIHDPCFAISKAAAYQSGRVTGIADIHKADLTPCYISLLESMQVRANLVVPILIRQQSQSPELAGSQNSTNGAPTLWGLLIAHHCQAPRQWQAWEMELIQQFAVQAGIAIQQSALYQQIHQLNTRNEFLVSERTAQLQEALNYEALLKRIADRVRDSLDERQILQAAVQELTLLSFVDASYAFLFDSNTDNRQETYYEHTDLRYSLRENLLAISHLPEIQPQLQWQQTFQFCSMEPHTIIGQLSILCSPVIDDRRHLGYLWLVKPAKHPFSKGEIRLVQQVANQCAIALRQSRLYQAAQAQVRELERLNQLKDDFLSTVSHELRTPMSSIKMSIQMLEILLFNQQQINAPDHLWTRLKQYFQILRDESQREINLINDLLDLSRLDAGTEPYNPTTMALQPWIEHIAEPYIARARLQEQTLRVEIPADLPDLTTDLSHLGRVVAELLHNACKYTPAKGEITVTAAIAEPSNFNTSKPQLRLKVTNTGIEIPSSELEQIFEKFYRIPNNDPWKHGGTGLGLALVKRLIAHLGGTIWAESGNGATWFTIELAFSL